MSNVALFELDSRLNQAFLHSAEDETFTKIMTAVMDNGNISVPGPTHATIIDTADLVSRSNSAMAAVTHLTLQTPDSIFSSSEAWNSHMDHLGRRVRDHMPRLETVVIVKVASLSILQLLIDNAPKLAHVDMCSAYPVTADHVGVLAATRRLESVRLNMYEAKGLRSPSAGFACWATQHSPAISAIELVNCMHMKSCGHCDLFRLPSLRTLTLQSHRLNTIPSEIDERWDFAATDAPYQKCVEAPFNNMYNIHLARVDDGFIRGLKFLAPTLDDVKKAL